MAWQSYIKEAEDVLNNAASTDEEETPEPKPAAVEPEEIMEDDAEDEAARQDADYALSAPWCPQDLPEVVKPDEPEAQFWIHLAANVFDWSERHAGAQCTYQQLLGAGDPQTLMGSLIKLIGMDFWKKMYGDREVAITDIVPRHLGFVLYNALQKPFTMATACLGKDAATKAKEAATASNKVAVSEMKVKRDKATKGEKARKALKTPLGSK